MPKNSDIIDKIKDGLTRTFKTYNKSTIETWSFYLEDGEYIRIPRFYPVENMIGCRIIDKRCEGIDINIRHNIVPRNNLQEKALKYMISRDRGIINLNTGEGKTVITIMAIAEIKKKSIILVHRANLIEQWIERIENFTNLKLGNDIAILDNNKIRKSFDNSIVISTVQALCSALNRKKDELLNEIDRAQFGLMVSDEIHTTVGARTFSECSLFIPAKKIFGLSATPYRHDGTSDILQYHLGPIYKPEGESSIMDAKVMMFFFNSGLLPESQKYIYWGGDFQRARYLNLLYKTKIKKICLGLMYKLKEDRNIFLIAERKKLIRQLYEEFDYEDKSTFIEKDSNEKLKHRVVLATPGKLRDGMDQPEKDLLILTSPIGNIQQACGRILRSYPGKKIPIIIDLIDINCFDIFKTYHYRLKFYKSRNWDIEYFKIDKEIIPINESNINDLIKK